MPEEFSCSEPLLVLFVWLSSDSFNNRFEASFVLAQNIPTRMDAHTTNSWNVSVLKLTRDDKELLREDFLKGDDLLD